MASNLTQAAEPGSQQQFIELRQYHLQVGNKKQPFNDYLEKTGIPALNRAGIEPVGAFSVMFGQNKPSMYLLLPHQNIDSVLHFVDTMMKDQEQGEAGMEYAEASISEPMYLRFESSLMRAFSGMPRVKSPKQYRGRIRVSLVAFMKS